MAKIVGITLVVGSGLPLGKEGPMVHIGAAVASLLSNVQVGWMGNLFELRLPSSQRGWVGMGAAAGVAAAFNAPLGGILYSFEEVCSHWSASMTWRSFVCAVVVAASGTFFIEFGGLGHGDFVIGLPDDSHFSFSRADIGWFALLGISGGVMGAAYNEGVRRLNLLRKGLVQGKAPRRVAFIKLCEAIALSLVCPTILTPALALALALTPTLTPTPTITHISLSLSPGMLHDLLRLTLRLRLQPLPHRGRVSPRQRQLELRLDLIIELIIELRSTLARVGRACR